MTRFLEKILLRAAFVKSEVESESSREFSPRAWTRGARNCRIA